MEKILRLYNQPHHLPLGMPFFHILMGRMSIFKRTNPIQHNPEIALSYLPIYGVETGSLDFNYKFIGPYLRGVNN